MNGQLLLIRNVASSLMLILPLVSLANPLSDFPCGGPHKQPFSEHKPVAGPYNSDRMPPYLEGINLSDSQQAKISEIMKIQGSQLREKADMVRKAHDALRQQSFSSEYNDDKAKSFAEASARYMAELTLLHARLDHDIFTVLNMEQQHQVQENMAKFKEHLPPH